MGGVCECDNEPSDSIKCGEFLVAEILLASQKELCFMELVIYLVDSKHVRNFFFYESNNLSYVCKTVKLSRYRPGQPLGVPRG